MNTFRSQKGSPKNLPAVHAACGVQQRAGLGGGQVGCGSGVNEAHGAREVGMDPPYVKGMRPVA